MNLQNMMKKAQEMQQKLADMQAKLETEETSGSSGGGLVELRLNGKNKLLKVSIDPSLLKADEKEMLEDLLVAAHNDARTKMETNVTGQMDSITSGLSLPPGFKLPF